MHHIIHGGHQPGRPAETGPRKREPGTRRSTKCAQANTRREAEANKPPSGPPATLQPGMPVILPVIDLGNALAPRRTRRPNLLGAVENRDVRQHVYLAKNRKPTFKSPGHRSGCLYCDRQAYVSKNRGAGLSTNRARGPESPKFLGRVGRNILRLGMGR